MRRLLPTSMAGWLILLIVLGLGVSQAVTIAIHYDSRREAQLLLENVRIAERIVAVTRAIDLLRLEERPAIAVGVSKSGLIVAWEPGNAVNKNKPRNDRAQLIAEVIDDRHEGLELLGIEADYFPTPWSFGGTGTFDTLFGERVNDVHGRMRNVLDQNPGEGMYVISLQLADRTWVNIAAPDVETVPAWSTATTALILVTLVIVLGLSVLGIRLLTAPLSTLTQAAERLGRNVNAPPLPEAGASDVIQAIRAFNDMQERIRRFVEDRTRMIAAISHDLRTPITRMRLRAELIGESEQQQKMLADLAEMETMIASTLSFAREDANPEARQRIDLVELLTAVCADIPQARLSMEPPSAPVPIDAQPVALRRGFTNLIDNAVRYGSEAQIA
ncbi:MAG TPA: histidine kinase dimerization/phospho-acceptor domain-containing protein [Verrucomicrobiae bacterium]|nr:histidine kinase dimerization/phospho-acceptor domain-containing protein [Verrucomicrobiae bacterium]